MRSANVQQLGMFAYISVEDRVPRARSSDPRVTHAGGHDPGELGDVLAAYDMF